LERREKRKTKDVERGGCLRAEKNKPTPVRKRVERETRRNRPRVRKERTARATAVKELNSPPLRKNLGDKIWSPDAMKQAGIERLPRGVHGSAVMRRRARVMRPGPIGPRRGAPGPRQEETTRVRRRAGKDSATKKIGVIKVVRTLTSPGHQGSQGSWSRASQQGQRGRLQGRSPQDQEGARRSSGPPVIDQVVNRMIGRDPVSLPRAQMPPADLLGTARIEKR